MGIDQYNIFRGRNEGEFEGTFINKYNSYSYKKKFGLFF